MATQPARSKVTATAPAKLTADVQDITPGKSYEIVREVKNGFYMDDDAGHRIFCSWERSAHLDFESWTRGESQ